jgi:S1-C subfamily serine protease
VGTGFLIAGERILTNAHVVRNAQQVTVKKNDGSAPTIANVDAIDEGCDLAVLRVASSSFLQGMRPLAFGELPQVGSSVTTYGYPVGGQELSTTAGVVSRYESHAYASTIGQHLVVQTDAAINPGNSGGPVAQGNLVVGVAFQTLRTEQNIGFFIPVPVIHHFLNDLADKHYDGFPDLPVTLLPLNSPAYRRERKLPDRMSGLVVQEIAAGSGLETVLAPDDVLVSIDGQALSDDGTWLLGKTRIPYSHLVDMKSPGQPVRFGVWRDGKSLTVEWKAARFAPWDRMRPSSGPPRYYVYAGLLFVPLTFEYFASTQVTAGRRAAMLHELAVRPWEERPGEDHEIVILANVFHNPVNTQIMANLPAIVTRVNGQSIKQLSDVVHALEGALTKKDLLELAPYQVVEAIDHEQARAAHQAILSTYGIPHDRNL